MKNDKTLYELVSAHRSALMGGAALWILFFHSWQFTITDTTAIGELLYFIRRIGFCGVDIFFFLSGMGLVRAMEKEKVGEFYLRRFKKLLIPVLILAALMITVDHWHLTDAVKCLTGYSFYHDSIYSFIWFYPAIATLYLVFPIYYYFLAKSKSKGLFTVGLLSAWLIISILVSRHMREDMYGFTNRIPVFITGAYFATTRDSTCSKAPVIGYVKIAATTLMLGLLLSWETNYNGMALLVPVPNCCIPNYLMSISLCIIVSYLLDSINVLRWIDKILAFLGGITFEMYCFQDWLFQKCYYQIFPISNSYLFTNIIFFLVVILVSYVLNRINRKICNSIQLSRAR